MKAVHQKENVLHHRISTALNANEDGVSSQTNSESVNNLANKVPTIRKERKSISLRKPLLF